MSFIRGAVVTLFGLVLVISLVLMNISITFASSLTYESLKPAMETTVGSLIASSLGAGSAIDGEELNNYCNIEQDYTLNYGNESFLIPCEIIEEGEDSISSFLADEFVDKIYYSEYNCEFWECVKTSEIPFVLFSDKARIYWAGKAFLLAAISLVLFILIFLVSERRPAKFISVGILLALCALPFKNLNWVLKLVPAQLSPIFSLVSEKAHSLFIVSLILAIILVLIGIISLIFGWKMKFKEDQLENKEIKQEKVISKSEVRQIVREEMSKKTSSKQKANFKQQKPKRKN